MNNTTTKNLAIVAVLFAAILVVGATFSATTAQSAFAYHQKKKEGGGDENSKKGNTITIQKCKQAATQSGFDNKQEQECQNVICTHPGENATCVQEAAAAPIPTPVNKTCEQCFTTLINSGQLNQEQINALFRFFEVNSIPDMCSAFVTSSPLVQEHEFRLVLSNAGVSPTTADELIACLKDAGIVFQL